MRVSLLCRFFSSSLKPLKIARIRSIKSDGMSAKFYKDVRVAKFDDVRKVFLSFLCSCFAHERNLLFSMRHQRT